MCPRRPGLSLSGIKNKFGNGIPYHGATTTNSAPWGEANHVFLGVGTQKLTILPET